MYQGIDVSKWQGEISFSALNSDPPDFMMIRAGSGTQFDLFCEKNARQCEAYRIPYGLYWASYAENFTECLDEAHRLLKVAKTLKPTYPLAYDIEEFTFEGLAHSKDKATAQDYIKLFCSEIEWHNYYAMFYTSLNCYKVWSLEQTAKRYDYWCAAWRSKKPEGIDCGIWQHSNKGKYLGINGDVDLNYSFKNYPEIIERNGLNIYK